MCHSARKVEVFKLEVLTLTCPPTTGRSPVPHTTPSQEVRILTPDHHKKSAFVGSKQPRSRRHVDLVRVGAVRIAALRTASRVAGACKVDVGLKAGRLPVGDIHKSSRLGSWDLWTSISWFLQCWSTWGRPSTLTTCLCGWSLPRALQSSRKPSCGVSLPGL